MSRICAIIQELESTEFVADFVTTAGAMGTETIGANTAPARRRALVPSDNSVDSKCNLLTSEKYLHKGKSAYSVDSV